MKFFERLLGRRSNDELSVETARRYRRQNAARAGSAAGMSEDERAIARYRYLLQTAPPETIEEAHAEAFAQLTPEQRRMVLQQLSQEIPERELAGLRADADDPRALARLATRAEMRRPGALERTFSSPALGVGAGGVGLGGLMLGSFLSTIAGVVVGTAIADAFFADSGYDAAAAEGGESGAEESGETGFDEAGADGGDTGADIGSDFGGDFGGDLGGDLGGDIGTDFGGDFGGGDFGGGDF